MDALLVTFKGPLIIWVLLSPFSQVKNQSEQSVLLYSPRIRARRDSGDFFGHVLPWMPDIRGTLQRQRPVQDAWESGWSKRLCRKERAWIGGSR